MDTLPTFEGWNPSTSLPGSTRSNTRCSSMCWGSGSCTSMPWILGSPLRRSMTASSCLGRLLGQPDGFVVQARLAAGPPLHADVHLGGGVVPHQDDGQPRGDATGLEPLELRRELGPHLPGDCRAVDEFGATWQRSPPAFRGPPPP